MKRDREQSILDGFASLLREKANDSADRTEGKDAGR
jgi:hypothetical protein